MGQCLITRSDSFPLPNIKPASLTEFHGTTVTLTHKGWLFLQTDASIIYFNEFCVLPDMTNAPRTLLIPVNGTFTLRASGTVSGWKGCYVLF